MNATDGDKIDKACRNIQDGQTIGIPIGPDSSLIIAELLLSAVDQQLGAQQGLRYIDDYELGFQTLAEAEAALSQFQSALAEFELNVNPRKTEITEGPIAIDANWAIELSRFIFRDSSTLAKTTDTIAFFSRAFDLAKTYPRHGVLRYATFHAQTLFFDGDGWFTFQGLLYHTITNDAGAIPVAIVLLERHVQAGQHINKTSLGKALESIVARHAPLGHGSEVAWALWTAIQFKVDLSSVAGRHISTMEDDIVALLALDARARGRIPFRSIDTTKWDTFAADADALKNEHWLLAYEGNLKGWLKCPSVARHAFFSILHGQSISFYDSSRKLTKFSGAAAGIPGGTLRAGYI